MATPGIETIKGRHRPSLLVRLVRVEVLGVLVLERSLSLSPGHQSEKLGAWRLALFIGCPCVSLCDQGCLVECSIVKQVAHSNQGCNLRFLDMTEGAALSALAVHVAELTPCLKAVKVEQAQVDGQTR